ncbi:spore-associated protein A [Streptomyces sp. NPDC102467]|uniref:spore-associated protein A n=1 Tax=Streptomyces sp. NPDC102467 TaxID=3366179 RepID=UPI0038039117
MRAHRKIAGSAAAVALAAAGLTVAASPAQAAATAYNGACGSGYKVIDSMSVNSGSGTVYLTYNNGYNCVVTVNNLGRTAYVDARVEVSGGNWQEDEGRYSSYAGPVYVYAAGKCIDWGGYVSPASSALTDIRWNDHCG